MGRSSSCQNGLHGKNHPQRVCSYHILYSYGREVQHWGCFYTLLERRTSLMNLFSSSASSNSSSVTVGFMWTKASKAVERKGNVSTRRAQVGVCPFLTLNLHSRSINLWQQTGLSTGDSRMFPTLQSTFPDQTEGLLGPLRLQAQNKS